MDVSNRIRYERAAHAMQSGVAMEMNYDASSTEPKHLRVGVNSALIDSGAIARVLITKGVITEEEYTNSLAECMEEEAKRYEKLLSDRLGRKVTLS